VNYFIKAMTLSIFAEGGLQKLTDTGPVHSPICRHKAGGTNQEKSKNSKTKNNTKTAQATTKTRESEKSDQTSQWFPCLL